MLADFLDVRPKEFENQINLMTNITYLKKQVTSCNPNLFESMYNMVLLAELYSAIAAERKLKSKVQ